MQWSWTMQGFEEQKGMQTGLVISLNDNVIQTLKYRLMKKTVLLVALRAFMAVATLLTTASAQAQTLQDSLYLLPDMFPQAIHFLPAPPDSASYAFLDDVAQWQWAKTVPTERLARASRESLNAPETMRTVMAQCLDLDTIGAEQTPALSRLLVKSYIAGILSTIATKNQYQRKRPFVVMNEVPLGQYDDPELLRLSGSFPSGHTASGWATALAFAEMWPALQDTILRRGFEFGENRVIVNAHWQSDVTAGYLCAAAAIARLHHDTEFSDDVRAARAEYAQLKGVPVPDGFPLENGVDVPHGERFLNDPVDTASARYMTDLMLYWSNKPVRYTPRGDTATVEAEYSVGMMQKVMGEAMQLELSDEATPAITALLDYVLTQASTTADRLKPIRFRKRPFVQLGEPSAVAGDEEKERGKSSFPSGHTNLGWTTALVMAELAPDYQEEILRRGYEYGRNRLIVGYHWFTDIEATRQLSSALVARLHADPTFCQLMAAARTEYANQTTGIEAVQQATSEEFKGSEGSNVPTYRLDGTRLNDQPASQGVYIYNGKKVLLK